VRDDYDLIIVGGGLSGGSLALALQSSGLRIALLEAITEQQRVTSPAGDRALALSYGSVEILAKLGLWAGAEQHATAITNIHISDRGHFGKTRLSAKRERVPVLGYVITARALENEIADALVASPVDLICPARLIGLKAGPDKVCVSLKRGEESLTATASLLVGADGGNSSVRKLLGIEQEITDYCQTAIITTVKPEIDPVGMAYERFTSYGPLAFLPTRERCCSVVWTQTSENAQSIAGLNEIEFVNQLQKIFGYRLGDLVMAGPRVSFPLRLIRARGMTADRCVLVGNAVHQLHPVAGQGFNLGLRDVAILAEKLIDCACAGEDIGSKKLLDQYSVSRRKDHDAVARFTDGLVRLFSNEWGPVSWARNAGLIGLDCFPLGKRVLARHAMGLSGRRPRLGVETN